MIDKHKTASRQKSRKWAAEQGKGVPIPGTGVNRYNWHDGGSKRNPSGALTAVLSWSDDPKDETKDRKLNKRARRESIEDQLEEVIYEQPDGYEDWDDIVEDRLKMAGIPSTWDEAEEEFYELELDLSGVRLIRSDTMDTIKENLRRFLTGA